MDYFVGIDLGGTIIKIGLVCDGQVVAITTTPANSLSGIEARITDIDCAIRELLNNTGLDKKDLLGIGICFPGLVNTIERRVISTNAKYDDAPTFDWSAWSYGHWGVDYYIDNDARMATVGEWQYGAGRGNNNLAMITIGTGIGTSVIIEGKLLYGKHFQAGCLGGHLVVNYLGRRCTCGNRGCVEAEASTWSIEQDYLEWKGQMESTLKECPKVDYRAIFAHAAEGDRLAVTLRDKSMDIWSALAVNLIHAYDPEVIIIGGGVMRSGDIILPYMQSKVDENAWTPWGRVVLHASELGDNAGIVGVCYKLNEMLKNKQP